VTGAEKKERFNRLSEMGCCICGRPPQIHHLIGSQHRGMGQKAPDEKTIPLCQPHHTGQEGIHKMGMHPWEEMFGAQVVMLDWVNTVMGMDSE
jgi:hypothetical protein